MKNPILLARAVLQERVRPVQAAGIVAAKIVKSLDLTTVAVDKADLKAAGAEVAVWTPQAASLAAVADLFGIVVAEPAAGGAAETIEADVVLLAIPDLPIGAGISRFAEELAAALAYPLIWYLIHRNILHSRWMWKSKLLASTWKSSACRPGSE